MTKLKALAWGFCGAGLALALWYVAQALYQDHQNVAALVQLEVQRQNAARSVPPVAPALPTPTAKK